MSKIKIKNFGPIKEGYAENDGWLDVKKVTIFIGNQGSGKSVVAKLISTFTWIEKALTRGDYGIKEFERKDKLKRMLEYHRLENYFPQDLGKTVIEYEGDSYYFNYDKGYLQIKETKNGNYPLPQIMYVPAERNFIANVKTPKALNLTSDSLIEFVTEFDNAKNKIKGALKLHINDIDDIDVEYNKLNDVVYIKGTNYKIKLTEASSGFQSLVPLYLVSQFLANSVKRQSENTKELMTSEQRERFRKRIQVLNEMTDLTDEQKRIAISEEAKKFNKTVFLNIVEEPEQNLFPSSQKHMLNSLLEFANMNEGNKLIMTTHSPYLINYLTLAVKASELKEKIKSKDLKNKLNDIVPLESMVKPDDIVIYECDEESGKIKKLDHYQGIPSDNNYLNNSLAEGNQSFDSLLEIEQGL